MKENIDVPEEKMMVGKDKKEGKKQEGKIIIRYDHSGRGGNYLQWKDKSVLGEEKEIRMHWQYYNLIRR